MEDEIDIKDLIDAAKKLDWATWPSLNEKYPAKDDTIFEAGSPHHLNACLGFSLDETGPYLSGYAYAGRLLAQFVCLTQRHMDTLIYPIVFLYRHHIELMLKCLIVKGSFILENSLQNWEEKQVPSSHRLDKLWVQFRPIFLEIFSSHTEVTEIVEGIDSYIKQLTEIDPESFSFRYARSKNREKINLENVKHINIYHFAECMERLVSILEGCDCHFSALEDGMGCSVNTGI